jgi:hypothetical protein
MIEYNIGVFGEKMKTALFAFALLLPSAARAQPAPAQDASSDDGSSEGAKDRGSSTEDDDSGKRPSGGKEWGLTFKQKAAAGNQGYRQSDTSLDLDMPYGLDLNADLDVYKNSTSSATPTVTLGGGWTQGLVSYTGTYAITTLANNYQAVAADVGVSVKTDVEDFRTILSIDVSDTHHRNYTYIPKANPKLPEDKNEQDITQLTPTASLTQKLFGSLDAKVTLSQNVYNRDLLAYTTALNRTKTPAQRAFGRADSNLLGVVTGFPNWSAKYGLNYDFDAIPLTLRGTYENIHLEDTAQGTNVTADAETYAADYDVVKWLTISANYDHTRQTSQPDSDVYGLRVALSF